MRSILEWLSRLSGTFRRRRDDADLAAELQSHLTLASDAARRDADDAHTERSARLRAGGGSSMDALRDQRGFPWLESLLSDVRFGWRRLLKTRTASATAILSLGLAIGAITATVRLADALLFRPLPVSQPERLFVAATTYLDSNRQWDIREEFAYPTYRDYAAALGADADAMVVGLASPGRVAVAPGGESDLVYRQYVSGNFFGTLGLIPEAGRLFGPHDDETAAARPVAVLSHQFWQRRFGGDRGAVGRSIYLGNLQVEIAGVVARDFTGTEPGVITDVYLPARMNAQALNNRGWVWFRLWLRARPGVSPEQIQQKLQQRFRSDQLERVKTLPAGTPQDRIDAYLNEEVRLASAASGVSVTQKSFRTPLLILIGLATLVLLMACVNVASALVAQSIARQQEMALRVSIGATRARLVRLVLVESALLAIVASGLAMVFAAWAAPLIVSLIESSDRPLRLVLDPDWRAFGFSAALTVVVTVLFGLAPALRASAVRPVGALKLEKPQEHRRVASVLVAGQTAFSFMLLFVTGLFLTSYLRVANRPLGFSSETIVLLDAEARDKQPAGVWEDVAQHLNRQTGVESAAVAGWAPLSGNRWTGGVRVAGESVSSRSAYFVDVSAEYFRTMNIGMIGGRTFRRGDNPPGVSATRQPVAGVAVVNEAFARSFFGGADPVGQKVSVGSSSIPIPMEIVGLVGNAAYLSVRETMAATVYVPMEPRDNATILVRTSGDPMALGPSLGKHVTAFRGDLRVDTIQAQALFVTRQMVRDRVLATLSLFFAGVAVLLAGIGLYGVVNSSVARQRREIAIRMALGAGASRVIRASLARLSLAALAGAGAGLAAGFVATRAVSSLLFQVSPTDVQNLVVPAIALATTALLAALTPVLRAIRTDPVRTLRE